MCTLAEKSNQNGFYNNNTYKSPFSNEMENRLEVFLVKIIRTWLHENCNVDIAINEEGASF